MLLYTPQVIYFTEEVSVLAVNIEISRLLERYGEVLSDKQQRILDGYYNCDLSLSEIAENEGMTRQGASDFVKRSEAALVELEAALGFCKKSEELKSAYEKVLLGEDIKTLAELIENI